MQNVVFGSEDQYGTEVMYFSWPLTDLYSWEYSVALINFIYVVLFNNFPLAMLLLSSWWTFQPSSWTFKMPVFILQHPHILVSLYVLTVWGCTPRMISIGC